MSIHIGAEKGQIASKILLPGDPLRAKFVAENYLTEIDQFNNVRGMLGYTGLYKGEKVSVMGTGMGIPSISIYVNELLMNYDVKQLIRIGSCGSFQKNVRVNDIVLAQGACTDSTINKVRFQHLDYAPIASFNLLNKTVNLCLNKNINPHVGNILSTDTFYHDDPNSWQMWAKYNVLAVEMESSALYTIAAKYKVEALSILTVSDCLLTHESLSSKEREVGFKDMTILGLEL